jgi:hypothetical protein
MAKLVGITLPANLAHGATLTETVHDNTTNSLATIDSILGSKQIIYSNNTRTALYNSTTLTQCATYTVPGGMLGTGNIIRIRAAGIYKNLIGTTRSITIRVTYGSTYVDLGFETDVTTRNWDLDLKLFANGASAQDVAGFVHVNNNGSASPWFAEILNQTFAETSSGDLALKIEMQAPSSAGANYGWEFWYCQYELLDFS